MKFNYIRLHTLENGTVIARPAQPALRTCRSPVRLAAAMALSLSLPTASPLAETEEALVSGGVEARRPRTVVALIMR